jgi:hypothetical protein
VLPDHATLVSAFATNRLIGDRLTGDRQA